MTGRPQKDFDPSFASHLLPRGGGGIALYTFILYKSL